MISGDLEEEVSKLKEQYKEDVAVYGSGQLARSLFDLGLVDELRLMIFPGRDRKGQAHLRGIDMHAFELADLKTGGDDGVIVQLYKPRK